MFCTHCGKPVDDHARFCPHCGQALGSPTPAAKEPAPAAAPPPTPSKAGEKPAPRAKRRTLPIVLAVVAAVLVILLVAAGILFWRFLSQRSAYEDAISDARAAVDAGDYDAAIDAYQAAQENQFSDPLHALELAEAYLCDGQSKKAADVLSQVTLEKGSDLLPSLERLNALSGLDPEIEKVDVSAFPTVTLTVDLGENIDLDVSQFVLTEEDVPRDILTFEQDGSTVKLTYRAEDTDASEEPREAELFLAVELPLTADKVTYDTDADYRTPYFEPAQLTLVSTDVSEYPRVKAFFRVSNANSGANVEGLDTGSFTILERVEGGEYLAREVKSAMPLEGNAGLNIDLVADKSDSITTSDMNKIKDVMTEFVTSLHYSVGDKAELLAFDSIVQQMCCYTGNPDLLINGIRNMSTDGLTAFYDAVYDGVTNAALQGGARCVIAFTDGDDNSSIHSAREVIRYANARQVPVYIIGVGYSVETGTLRSMAEETGGRYWHIDDLYDLQEIFDEIYSYQKDLYVVEYESDADLDCYLTRDLSVQVSGGGCRTASELSFTPVRSINDGGGSLHTSRYELIPECLSWEEASRRCQEMGGHLATITSQDEMDLLIAMAEAAGMKYLWLGGYTSYDDAGSVFGHWVTGEEFSYQAWCQDEPSRVDLDGTGEWYIMLWNIPSLGGWTWNDQRNDPASVVTSMADEMAFICEFET